MKKIHRFIISVAALIGMSAAASAQNSDFGIWTEVGAEKGITENLSASVGVKLRSQDMTRQFERVCGYAFVEYSICSWLKADAGYEYIHKYNLPDDDVIYDEGFEYPGTWESRHRANVSLTASVNWGPVKFSLRERYRYAHISEDGEFAEHEHILRSRLTVEWKISEKCPVRPYVAYELYSWAKADKMRYNIGGKFALNEHNSLDIFYRIQDRVGYRKVTDHVLGITYAYSF